MFRITFSDICVLPFKGCDIMSSGTCSFCFLKGAVRLLT